MKWTFLQRWFATFATQVFFHKVEQFMCFCKAASGLKKNQAIEGLPN